MLDYAAITTSSTLTSLEHSHHPTYLTAKRREAPLSYVSRHCLSHLRAEAEVTDALLHLLLSALAQSIFLSDLDLMRLVSFPRKVEQRRSHRVVAAVYSDTVDERGHACKIWWSPRAGSDPWRGRAMAKSPGLEGAHDSVLLYTPAQPLFYIGIKKYWCTGPTWGRVKERDRLSPSQHTRKEKV
jgi:hypothetical protein